MGQWPSWGAWATPTWRAAAPLPQGPVPEPRVPYSDLLVGTHPAAPKLTARELRLRSPRWRQRLLCKAPSRRSALTFEGQAGSWRGFPRGGRYNRGALAGCRVCQRPGATLQTPGTDCHPLPRELLARVTWCPRHSVNLCLSHCGCFQPLRGVSGSWTLSHAFGHGPSRRPVRAASLPSFCVLGPKPRELQVPARVTATTCRSKDRREGRSPCGGSRGKHCHVVPQPPEKMRSLVSLVCDPHFRAVS